MLVIMLLMMVMVMVLKMMMMTMLMILVYDLAQDNGALAEPRVGQYPQGIQAWHTGHISPSSSPSSWPASSSSPSSCLWFFQTMIGSKAPPSILNWVFKYMHCRKVFLTRLIFVFTFVSRSVQMSLYQPMKMLPEWYLQWGCVSSCWELSNKQIEMLIRWCWNNCNII